MSCRRGGIEAYRVDDLARVVDDRDGLSKSHFGWFGMVVVGGL